MATAADIADREGLEALSLSGLATRLGVRVPSLYKHIGGLDDLLRRLSLEANDALSTAVRAAVDGRRGRDALIAFALAYRSFALRYPGRFAAARWAAMHGLPDARVDAVLSDVLCEYGSVGTHSADAAPVVRSGLQGFLTAEASGQFGAGSAAEPGFVWLVSVLDCGLAGLPGDVGRRLWSLGACPGLT